MAGAAEFHLRQMEDADLSAALQLSTGAGWNQTSSDWQLFLSNNPSGCFVGVAGGGVVGTVTTIRYGGAAWISMLLVHPDYQGKGLGKALFRAALQHLQDVPVQKLDATPAGRPLYEKMGFILEEAWDRWHCPSWQGDAVLPNAHLTPYQDRHCGAVLKLDQVTFGLNRGPVLQSLLQGPAPHQSVCTNGEDIQGFAACRPGVRYWQVGPLTAAHLTMAQELVRHVLQPLRGRAIILDVPQARSEWGHWLEQQGFTRQRPLYRMVRGAVPQPFRAQEFAIGGPEFG